MQIFLVAAAVAAAVALAGLGLWLYTPDKTRGALEAKYGVTPADYVDAAGLRIRFRRTGPAGAPAVILLHGFGSSLETWEPWAMALSDRYDVIRFDLPGFGLTGADPTGDYSDARSLAVLSSLMDRLGVAHAALVGNSLGGKIAWMFAARYPERVDRLVLISPDGFASPGFAYGVKPTIPAVFKMLRFILPKAAVRMTLAPAYADPAHAADDVVTRYQDMMRAPGVRGAMLDRMGQAVEHPPEARLATIQAPTLLVWGQKDDMIPFANSADYLRVMPHARLASFADLGHVPQEEGPAESLPAVRQFLDTKNPAPE